MRAEAGRGMPLTVYLDETIADWHRQRPKAKYEYRKDGPLPAPSILAELTLTHALVNILNNAADASPEVIEIAVRWNRGRATVAITDHGPGIAPNVSAHLGKMPVTTKEQGLGVGLFLAFNTIERLGGRLEMSARAEGGTRTTIELPLLAA